MSKEQEKALLKYLVIKLNKKLREDKVEKIDSNWYHFTIYNLAEGMKLELTRGLYVNGPYLFYLDDVLVESFGLDPIYHQLKSEHPDRFKWFETKKEDIK